MKIKDKTYDFLLFCGDIHSVIDVIPKYLKNMELTNCAVFQVGDFGIGFDNEHKENRRMDYLNERMKNYNSDLYVIRGNHDNPKYFDGTYNLSNLFLLKDYSEVEINYLNILCIGGAISIDRTKRKGYWDEKKTHDYWKDESIVFDEERLKGFRDIDIVVTHSAPSFCYPLSSGGIEKWIDKDEELNNDVLVERHNLSMMYEILSKNNKIFEWYNGHFHKSTTSYLNDTKFIGLNINEIVDTKLIYKF